MKNKKHLKYQSIIPISSDPIFIILNDENKFEGFYKGDIAEANLPKGWKFMLRTTKKSRFML